MATTYTAYLIAAKTRVVMSSIPQSHQGEIMLKALLALIGVLVEIVSDVAKRLVGLAFLLALCVIATIISLVLVLDHVVG